MALLLAYAFQSRPMGFVCSVHGWLVASRRVGGRRGDAMDYILSDIAALWRSMAQGLHGLHNSLDEFGRYNTKVDCEALLFSLFILRNLSLIQKRSNTQRPEHIFPSILPIIFFKQFSILSSVDPFCYRSHTLSPVALELCQKCSIYR